MSWAWDGLLMGLEWVGVLEVSLGWLLEWVWSGLEWAWW